VQQQTRWPDKAKMHLNFGFTAVQTLWTLTFAALLVLLVVLQGRDRTKRFPWFTASIVLVALRLLTSRLLFGRLPGMTLNGIFITLADVAALVGLLVVVEMARRAFHGVARRIWVSVTLAAVAVGGAVLYFWGPWPALNSLTANSYLAILRLMQLAAQKSDLLLNVLTIELGLLVVVFGRRFKAGFRSHTQQIVIGLSTAAIAQLGVQGIWQAIALKAAPQTQAEYEHILGLRDKLFNGNSVVYVAVLVWWIVCLWRDEPGTQAEAEALNAAPKRDYLESPVTPADEKSTEIAVAEENAENKDETSK
jgi:glycopeptide antibiotics resistance protein